MSIDKVVVAIILGDGHVSKRSCISFHHSAKQHDYLMYKVSILEKYGYKFSIRRDTQPSYGKLRDFSRAEGYSSTSSKKLRTIFYPNGVKIAPGQFVKDFGFYEWAFIYMDEGRANTIGHYNTVINGKRTRVETQRAVNFYEICTDGLDNESVQALRDNLLSLGIESRVSKRNRIIISRANSKILFYEGIKSFIHPSLEYKISTRPTLSYDLQ